MTADDGRNSIEFTSKGTAFTSDFKLDGVSQTFVRSVTIEASVDDPIVRVTVIYNMPNVDVALQGMKVVYEGEQ